MTIVLRFSRNFEVFWYERLSRIAVFATNLRALYKSVVCSHGKNVPGAYDVDARCGMSCRIVV